MIAAGTEVSIMASKTSSQASVLLLLLNASPLAGLHLPSPSLQQLHRPCATTVRVFPPRCAPARVAAAACRQALLSWFSLLTRRLAFDTTHPPHIGHEDAGGKGGTASKGDGKSSLVAGGSALAASALLCEGLQVAGTAVLFVVAQHYTDTSSPVQVRASPAAKVSTGATVATCAAAQKHSN